MWLSLTTNLKKCSRGLWCLVVIQIVIVVVYLSTPQRNVQTNVTPQIHYHRHTLHNLTGQSSQKYSRSRPTNAALGTRTTVAIGMGITTVHIENTSDLLNQLPFYSTFLASFCSTMSSGYTYNFYLAYDFDDKLLSEKSFRQELAQQFWTVVLDEKICKQSSSYSLTYVECHHSGNPAWAQNDAMIRAYLEGNEYFYRVNDDTTMVSPGWTERFIETLNNFDPPNVGVVGPYHHQGNLKILTYDFVHRTHVEIFGYYYPREFKTWFADGWITKIYTPGRMVKLKEITVQHTQELGRRYNVDKGYSNANKVRIIDNARDTISRYVSSIESTINITSHHKHAERSVISMCLCGDTEDVLWGLVRNAQIQKIYYPTWKVRVYVTGPKINGTISAESYKGKNYINRDVVIETLKRLNVEIVFLDNQTFPKSVPTELWHLIVADDPDIQEFIIRDPRQRFSWRESQSVSSWQTSKRTNNKMIHCLRDHPLHAKLPLVTGLWGANRTFLSNALGTNKTMKAALTEYAISRAKSKSSSRTFANSFLRDVIWPVVNGSVLCHDSVSCDQWPSSQNFESTRPKWDYIGNFYNGHETRLLDFKQWQKVKQC